MRWFKFYGQDWLTDTKIIRMKLEDKLLFITLLCLADEEGVVKDCDENAVLRITQLYNDPMDNENEWSRGEGFVQRFIDNGMITLSDNKHDVIIKNWVKRQGSSDTGYARLKRWREKQKLVNKPSFDDNGDNAMITVRREENRREDNILASPSFEIVKDGKEYPTDEFDMGTFLQKMADSPIKIERIIAWYWKRKKFKFENYKQAYQQKGRDAKAAAPLAKADYDIAGVEKVAKHCDAEIPLWTLETISKMYHRVV